MTTDLRRLFAWAVIAALATYLLFFGGAWLGLYLTDLRIVTVAAAGGLLTTWFIVMRRDPAWRPRSVLMPAILASLGSLAISTVFSRYPRVSLEYLAYAFVLAALYLLLVRLMANPFFRQRLVTLAATLFLVVIASYVFLILRHWIDWWTASGVLAVPPLRPEYESLTYGTPSTVLTVAGMLAVPTIATVVRSDRFGWAAAVGVVFLVGIIAVLTGSRAGWIALATASLITIAVAVADPGARSAVTAVVTPRMRRLIGLVVVVGLLLGVVLGPAIVHRATDTGEQTRLTFTRIALELFTESPVVGTGPGSWVIERVRHTRPDETDEYIPHAHNVYAQTLGELGLVGAVAGLVLAASLTLLCWRAMRSRDSTRRLWGWLTFGALAYFAAHQAFDFYPNMPAVLLTAAIPVALLDAIAAQQPATAGRRFSFALPRPAELGAAALVATSIAGLLLQEIPARTHDEAVDLANNGNWVAAVAPAARAAAEDPSISSYQFTAGLAEAWNGKHVAAASRFEAVAAQSDFPEAWLNLAAQQAQLGLRTEALASIANALRVGRQRPAVSMPAGDLALRLGDEDLAIDAFAAALSVTPSLAGDPWWASDQARTAIWPEILTEADSRMAPTARWELALMHGDVGAARALSSSTGDADYTLMVISAWTGDTAALTSLLARCNEMPNAVWELLWCARLADRAGDAESGARYRYVMNVQLIGWYRQAHELRVLAAPPRVYPILEGNALVSWGTYTFRRVTPWDVLVPGLVHLGFG
jgi:O-antigen ligase